MKQKFIIMSLLPWLDTALQFGTSILNMSEQKKLNRENREFVQKQYEQQKNDNLSFWQKQNEYNDPSQQMQRLQKAGLNPNMVYGNGSVVGTAGPIQGAEQKTPQTEAPQFRTPYLDKIYDYQIKKANIDNLKAQNQVLLEDSMYKRALTENVKASTDTRVFDLGYKTETKDLSLQGMQESLRQKKIANQFSLDENQRRTVINASNLTEAIQRIANMKLDQEVKKQNMKESDQRIKKMRQEISNLFKDGKIKNFEIKLNESAVTKNDPIYFRAAAKIIEETPWLKDLINGKSIRQSVMPNITLNPKTAYQNFKNFFNK